MNEAKGQRAGGENSQPDPQKQATAGLAVRREDLMEKSESHGESTLKSPPRESKKMIRIQQTS
jgi:hypothetical protein